MPGIGCFRQPEDEPSRETDNEESFDEAPLYNFFLSHLYANGAELPAMSSGYEYGRFGRVPVYMDEDWDIRVWRTALDFSQPPDSTEARGRRTNSREALQVLFFYTSPSTFARIVSSAFRTKVALLDLLSTGEGIDRCFRAMSKEPRRLSHAASPDPKSSQKGGVKAPVQEKWTPGGEATAFCIPLIVPKDAVYRANAGFLPHGYDPGDVWELRYSHADAWIRAAVVNQERRLRNHFKHSAQERGSKHQMTLEAMGWLAEFFEGRGRLDEAEETRLVAVRELERDEESGYRPDAPSVRQGLADLLIAKGRHADAEELLNKSLRLLQDDEGRRNAETLNCIFAISICLRAQGKLKEALPHLRTLHESCEALFGSKNSRVQHTGRDLAGVLLALGQREETTDLLRKLVHQGGSRASRRRSLSVGRVDTPEQEWIEHMGDLGLAEQLFAELLVNLREERGRNSMEALGLAADLASHLHEAGHLDLALPLYRQMAEAKDSNLGKAHPATLTARRHLATLLHLQGHLAEADAQFRFVLQHAEAQFGCDHVECRWCFEGLSFVLQDLGKIPEAVDVCHLGLLNARDSIPGHKLLASLMQQQGQFEDAEPYCRQILAACQGELGNESPTVLAALGDLAAVLRGQGKYADAEPLYRHILAVREAKLSLGHPELLEAKLQLAGLLEASGQLHESATLLRQAHITLKAARGPEHCDTLLVLRDLAELLRLQKRLKEADPLFQQCVRGMETAFGPEHIETYKAVRGLASLLLEQGNLEEAEELYQRCLPGLELALGDQHPETLTVICGLGILFRAKGKYEDAEPLYRHILQRYQALYGPEHIEYLRRANRFASLLQLRGRLDEAEALFRHVVCLLSEAMGPSDPDAVNAADNLAVLLQARDRHEEAQELHGLVLAVRERQNGRDHPDTLASTGNLVTSLIILGKLELAEDLLRRAIDWRDLDNSHSGQDTLAATLAAQVSKQSPENQQHTRRTMATLADVLRARGDIDGAEQLSLTVFRLTWEALGAEAPGTQQSASKLAELVELRETEDGFLHPNSLPSASLLASFFKALGKYDLAETVCRQCAYTAIDSYGDSHPDTLQCLGDLAGTLHADGKLEESEWLFRYVLAVRERTLGAMASSTLGSMDALAGLLRTRGNLTEAERFCRISLRRREEGLGAVHPDTLRNKNTLASVLRARGKFEEAEDVCQYSPPRGVGESAGLSQPEEEPHASHDSHRPSGRRGPWSTRRPQLTIREPPAPEAPRDLNVASHGSEEIPPGGRSGVT